MVAGKLLEVPRYDFNWQIRYELRNPYELPAGSRVEVSVFDNSANNPANPNPEATVYWGGTDQQRDVDWLCRV